MRSQSRKRVDHYRNPYDRNSVRRSLLLLRLLPLRQTKRRRRYGEAVQAYEKALELDPRQPAIHRNLGILLVRLGRYDEAVIHLRATLQLVPNEPLARETLDALEAHRR